jgi:hypothetical protein
VNPEIHHEFEALCALYYSGELSEEDWALLQIHMGYCDSCHERFLQYQRISSEVVPALAATAASEQGNSPWESSRQVEIAERRLLAGLDSSPVKVELRHPRRPGWRMAAGWIAACVLGVLAVGFGTELVRLRGRSEMQTMQPSAGQSPAQGVHEATSPDAQLASKHSQERIASLEQQFAVTDDQLRQADLKMAAVEKQLGAEQEAQKQLGEEKDRLTRQLAAAQTELDSMRNQWASTATGMTEQSARSVTLEAQVRELKVALDEKDVALSEKDRMLALDKDFLAHDRDIRDLIGARNLYIADIFDTNENGRTATQFGRIFYTRDRSLIFYGFDLDSQAGHSQNVSFQVWGSGSDRPSPVSLGLFYQDESHKRWVLRCNDAKSLARLDMVFVTVEPPGGSSKPTGKQLLRAYLQIHPNHP